MIRQLSRLPSVLRRARKAPCAPDEERIYAIGDIHGRADLLQAILEAIDREAEGRPDTISTRLVFLGDYIDRGPNSPEVLDLLIQRQKQYPNTICLLGNHEAAMLRFLEEPEKQVSWIDWGGEDTLLAYGVDPSPVREVREIAQDLRQALPAGHISFLKSLPIRYEAGDYLFVHAGLKPGVSIEDQSREDQLWIREEFHNTPANLRPIQTIIHGHQSAKKVVDKGWRICVDTGAVWNGKLTAVVLEGCEKRFLSVHDNIQ